MLSRKSIFVDNARFWSMLALVALHSVTAVYLTFPGSVSPESARLVQAFVKFGTIDFFLVSGFLLGDRFEQSRRSTFVLRRFQKVFLPWLFWFTLMTAWWSVHLILSHKLNYSSDYGKVRVLAAAAKDCLVLTPFWFVPNLLTSICVLLILRRHLRTLWLGCLLLSVTLFYAINIYALWIPASHLTAVGGYIFFLWLGAYASRRYERICEVLRGIPWSVLLLGVLATGLFSLLETNLLVRLGSSDALNTLRITNQIYSVAVLVFLMKLEHASWPWFVDARNQMFGVYLTQTLVLASEVSTSKRLAPFIPFLTAPHGAMTFLMGWVLVIFSVFGISIFITRALAGHANLGWLVGDLSESRIDPNNQAAAPSHPSSNPHDLDIGATPSLPSWTGVNRTLS